MVIDDQTHRFLLNLADNPMFFVGGGGGMEKGAISRFFSYFFQSRINGIHWKLIDTPLMLNECVFF